MNEDIQFARRVSNMIGWYKPFIYVIISGFGFSLSSAIVKLLEIEGYDGALISVFTRGVILSIISVYFIHIQTSYHGNKCQNIFGENNKVRLIMFWGGFLGYCNAILPFLSVQRISIGDSSTLLMLSPIFASIFNYGEISKLAHFIAFIVALIAVLVVVRPPIIFTASSNSFNSWGYAYALLGAMSTAAGYIVIHMLGRNSRIPWENLCFMQALGQLVLSFISYYLISSSNAWPSPWQGFLVLSASLAGACAQVLLTVGLHAHVHVDADEHININKVSSMRISELVFAFIWQYCITSDEINYFSVFGAFLIVLSTVIITVSSTVRSNKACNGDTIIEIELNTHEEEEEAREIGITNKKFKSYSTTELGDIDADIEDEDRDRDPSTSSTTLIKEWKQKIKQNIRSVSTNFYSGIVSLPRYYEYSKLSQSDDIHSQQHSEKKFSS